MGIGIYMYTNKINGKKYIGQSTQLSRRRLYYSQGWEEKRQRPITSAISKYGYENFKYEILQLCEVDELDMLEGYYMDKYNTYAPNGYNILSPRGAANTRPMIHAPQIKHELMDGVHPNTIAQKYSFSHETIRQINIGYIAYDPNIEYPILTLLQKSEPNFCNICDKSIDRQAKICSPCASFQMRKVDRPSKEVLIKELSENGFRRTSEIYGVSPTTIRRWCKGYGISSRAMDYK